MNSTVEDVRNAALRLPESDRRVLIHDLIDSPVGESNPEIEAAGDEEIQRRIREVDEGKVHCISHEEVMAKARKAIACPK